MFLGCNICLWRCVLKSLERCVMIMLILHMSEIKMCDTEQ